MFQLPDRPDLAQLRRQARELHRAAAAGDPGARRRMQLVSEKVTLSAAQLAVAREYGFASWPRLKDEAERRRASAGEAAKAVKAVKAVKAAPADEAAPVPVRSWREMRDWSSALLLSRSGADVAAWNRRIAGAGLDDEAALRAWLAGQGITGYAQALLVWERFGYPDFLTADADELIEGQYADRPHLRPVLDAVLAVLPTLGPLTVQARKTIVSLVSPRRTFAVVRATTGNRVDLGLRLESTEPGGRLLRAGNIGGGGATVRIALTGPGDVDDEVRDWMRRAYEENTAPPAARRPARRPGTVVGTMTVVIEGSELPGRTCRPEPDGAGHQNVHVALGGASTDRPALTMPGRPGMAVEPVPGDAPAARWEMPVTVRRDDDGFDFAGPFVRGVRDDRHLGLVWGDLPGDGTLRLFRGAKLRLVDIDPSLIEHAIRPRHKLIARIRLTDARGNPICARVHPPYLTWSVAGDGPAGQSRKGSRGRGTG